MSIIIEEAFKKLNNQKSTKTIKEGLSKSVTEAVRSNTVYPQLTDIYELIDLFNFLWDKKEIQAYLNDFHFSVVRGAVGDKGKNAVERINTKVENREYALIKMGIQDGSQKNNYAALDINTTGTVGSLKIFGWSLKGQARSISQFVELLKEFYESKNYPEEDVKAYLDLCINSAETISSKDYGSALVIYFGLKNPAPKFFKLRTKPNNIREAVQDDSISDRRMAQLFLQVLDWASEHDDEFIASMVYATDMTEKEAEYLDLKDYYNFFDE